MKVLITGITGMVGSHMADYLLGKANIIGLKRWRSPMDNIKHLEGKIKLYDGDLKDQYSLIPMIMKEKPDVIYHFAAQSYVPISFDMPRLTIEDNAIGTLNLLEVIRPLRSDYNPIIVIASSSEVYGQVTKEDIPIKETCPFRPMSPYAVSKVAEDMLGFQYFKSYKMNIIRTRLFTHMGVRRGDVFAESSFAKQIALIEKGKQDVIKVGNLDSIRTYLDVKDAVRSYWLVKDCPVGEVYNIGGDTTMTIGEMLGHLRRLSTAKYVIRFEIEESRLRPSDVTMQIPDSSKFRSQTGWKPEIPFETTLLDLLNFWRERV